MENFTKLIKQPLTCQLFLASLVVLLACFPKLSSAQLSGNYTIDPNGSGYPNFDSAVSHLSSVGVSGPVTFTVSSDTFKEKVSLKAISGASSTNTITFRGTSRNKTVIWANNSSSTVYLDGADYIHFSNMTIIDENDTGTSVQLVNSANYNRFDSCTLMTNNPSGKGVSNVDVWVESSSYNTFNGNLCIGGYYSFDIMSSADDNSYTNNVLKNYYYYGFYVNNSTDQNIAENSITGGTYGLYLYYGDDSKIIGNYIKNTGSYGIRNYYTDGTQMSHNTIVDPGSYGVYDYYSDGTVLDSNYIDGASSRGIYAYLYSTLTVKIRGNEISNCDYGIYSYYGAGSEYSGNKIYDYGYAGLYFYYPNRYSTSDSAWIYNNMIGEGQGSYYGVRLYYGYNVQLIHNSFNFSSSNYGVYLYSGSGNVVLNNSIVQNGAGYVFYVPSTSYISSMDYNNLHSTGSKYVYFAGTRSSLSSLKSYSSSYNQNSIDEDPQYKSSSDLHSSSIYLNNSGTNLSSNKYATDYDGQPRPTSPDKTVDIGADDYYLAPKDLDIQSFTNFGFDVGKNNLELVLKNGGTDTIPGQTISVGYSTNGGSSWTSQSLSFSDLPIGDTMHVSFKTAWTISSKGQYNLCYRISPQISNDPDNSDDTCINVCTGYSGKYTIDKGGNGDFLSFKDAIDAMICGGVVDSVTFTVTSGNYNEDVSVPEIIGTGSSKRIKFIGSGAKATAIKSLVFDGGDYFTFDNMTIGSKSNAGIAVEFKSDARYNEVLNSDIQVSPTSTSTNTRGVSENEAGVYNTVENCNIDGGYYNIYLYGDYGSSKIGVGFTVKNCELTNAYYYGTYTYYYDKLVYEGNYVHALRDVPYAYGARFAYNHDFKINGNVFDGEGYGVYLYYANYTSYWSSPSNNSEFYNNMISGTYYYGLMAYRPYYVNFYHNSINGIGTNDYGAEIYYAYYSNIKNNIFSYEGGREAVYLYLVSSCSFDNNLIYSSQGYPVNYSGTSYSSISNFYSSTGYCSECYSDDPNFTSSRDLHTNDVSANNRGDNSLGVKVDIDGDTRPYSPDTVVDIGADEFYLAPYDLDVSSVEDPVVPRIGLNPVSGTFKNSGSDVLLPQKVTFGYRINGGSWYDTTVTIDTLKPGDVMTLNFPKKFSISSQGNVGICMRINPQIKSDPDASDSICISRCTGKSGNYTIDPNGNGDFLDFGEAVDALECGITGPVTITVDSGTYNEQVEIGEVPGMGPKNPVIFKGVNQKQVVLTHGPSGSSDWATITLDGADYVTFKNMTIENTGSSYAAGVWLTNQADYNTISNCIIDMNGNTYYNSAGIVSTGTAGDVIEYGYNGSHNMIKNNKIMYGYYGVCLNGSGTTSLDEYNSIIGNYFSGQYYYGVRLYYQGYITVKSNEMTNFSYQYSYGIYSGYAGNFRYEQNLISSGRGMYIYRNNYYVSPDPNWDSRVWNNMVEAYTYYAYFYYSYDFSMYHNTFASDYSYTARLYYCQGVDMRNNMFINTGGGYAIYIYNYSNSFDYSDYNLYYTSGSTLIYDYGSTYGSVSDYESATGWEENGYDQMPSFAGKGDYHLTVHAKKFEGDILGVKYDVDGDKRCSYNPTIGADEGQYVYPSPKANFIYPDSVFVNSPVLFEAVASQGTQESYMWYINDSMMSITDTFTYTFNNTGKDTVSLVAENCGGTDSVSVVFDVKVPSGPPVVDFTADQFYVDQYDTVHFFDFSNNGPTSWTWDISPQYTSLGSPTYDAVNTLAAKNLVAAFYEPGVYEICLTAANSVGTSKKVCKSAYIQVRQSNSMCLNSSTSAATGTLYDDLGSYDAYSPNIDCNFLIEPCRGVITLKVDKFDLNSNDYLRIYDGVNANGKPLWDVPNYGLKGLTGNRNDPGFQTTFKAKSGRVYVEFETDGSDDGGKGFALSWTSKGGGSFTAPVADFDVPDTVCEGIRTWLQNTSTGSYNQYEWYDGKSLFPFKTEDFSVVFPDTGNYNIQLKAVNCGGRDSVTKQITVVPPTNNFNVGFTADNFKPAVAVDVVTLEDTTKGCVDEFEWKFNPRKVSYVNGTDQHSKSPQVVFLGTGCFDVTLIVGNGSYSDTITKKCYITPFGYCSPKVATLNPDIGINRVEFNTIDNSSLAGEKAYNDYTASISTNVQRGDDYLLTVERNSDINKMNIKAWIDFNIDGDFNDTLELVASSGVISGDIWVDTVSIPKGATIGSSRLRIGVNYNNHKNRPCGPNKYGEFEDYSVIIGPDVTSPEISLKGADTLTLEACMPINSLDIGALAMDNSDGNITSQIQMDTSNVDHSTAGIYPITYSVKDAAGNSVQVMQYIEVVPDATDPTLTLKGQKEDTVAVNNSYNGPGYSATDNCSGIKNVVVTSTIDTSTVGQYSITYTAKDKEGNSTVVTRIVDVVDTVAPTVTYQGPDTMVVDVNQLLDVNNDLLPSITLNDNYYSNMTRTLSGTFYNEFAPSMIPTKLGVYDLTMIWTDGSGNSTQKTINIKVVDRVAPVVKLINPEDAVAQIERFDKYDMDHNYLLNDNYYDSVDITVNTSGSYIDSYLVYSVKGLFLIKYMVTDPSGNSALYKRWVNVVESNSGIDDQGVDQPKISLYPNPTSGQFLINVELPTSGKIEIDIVNELGKKVTEVANENIIKGQYNVNLADESAGIYFVRIRTQDQVTMKRIVLTK